MRLISAHYPVCGLSSGSAGLQGYPHLSASSAAGSLAFLSHFMQQGKQSFQQWSVNITWWPLSRLRGSGCASNSTQDSLCLCSPPSSGPRSLPGDSISAQDICALVQLVDPLPSMPLRWGALAGTTGSRVTSSDPSLRTGGSRGARTPHSCHPALLLPKTQSPLVSPSSPAKIPFEKCGCRSPHTR